MRPTLVVLGLLAGSLVPTTLAVAPASARCAPPDGMEVVYKFRNKSLSYYPTNLKSDWVVLRKGGSISYTRNTTGTLSASATATVSAEAGVVFAKASTSLGVTVGKQWSKTQQWSYTANVPADASHRYRLHMYHYAANFDVRKYGWSYSTCRWDVPRWSSWQTVRHVPASANRNVWRLDKAAA